MTSSCQGERERMGLCVCVCAYMMYGCVCARVYMCACVDICTCVLVVHVLATLTHHHRSSLPINAVDAHPASSSPCSARLSWMKPPHLESLKPPSAPSHSILMCLPSVLKKSLVLLALSRQCASGWRTILLLDRDWTLPCSV